MNNLRIHTCGRLFLSIVLFLQMGVAPFASLKNGIESNKKITEPLSTLLLDAKLETQDSCVVSDGLNRLSVDNTNSDGATEGCLIDYSAFPLVQVWVKNPNSFWTEVKVLYTFNNVIVEPMNIWAEIGIIAPHAAAAYNLTFDNGYNSYIQFFVNASRSEHGINKSAIVNIASSVLEVLGASLQTDESASDIEYILNLFQTSNDLVLAADALSYKNLPSFLEHIYKALTDDVSLQVIGNIAARVGINLSISQLKNIFIPIKIITLTKDVWDMIWAIVTGSYAGSVMFTSQVQTYPPTPPPAPTPLPLYTPPPPPTSDSSSFVSDVTLLDGTFFLPNQTIVKTWRLRNTGNATWGNGYQLAFVSGNQMGASSSVNLPFSVAPNQTVDISVNITAPAADGTYQGNWRMRNPSGTYFGDSFWVNLQVGTSSNNITLTADPPSPASADQIRIYARINNFPNLRALRILIDGQQLCELGAPEIKDCVWHTNGYSTGQHSISAEADDWTGPSWDNPERRTILFNFTGSGLTNHAPYRPILVANPAYDWYVTIGNAPQICAQAQGDPDGDSVNQYRFVANASVGTVDSGWVGSSCYTFGSINPGTYEWHAQVKDNLGGVSDWSDNWHFTVTPSGIEAYIDHFAPGSSSNAEEVKIYGCTSGHSGVNITMRVLVNDANDGSDSGEWHIIKEQGSPCFNDVDVPIWRTLDYSDGPHRVRIAAWAIQPDAGDYQDYIYTLNHRRPASPHLVAPVPLSGNLAEAVYPNSRTITFMWQPAIRAQSYTLHVSTTQAPKDDPNPILRLVFDSTVTEYTVTFDQDYPTLYWQVEATNDAGNNTSGVQIFGIDRQNPTCTIENIASPVYESVFQVNWSGSDALAGIYTYDIQYMDSERGDWDDWMASVPSDKTYDLFTGQPGHVYYFRCRSTDNANNTSVYPDAANISVLVDPSARPPSPWWDLGYAHKRNITILNNMSGMTMQAGYPVHVHFDSTTTPTAYELYNASLSSPKCNDIRIVSNDAVEVNRIVKNCSSTAIDLWFRSQISISGGSSDSVSHQVYYGNASPASPAADPNQVWYPYREGGTTYLYFFQEGSGLAAYDASGNGRTCSLDPSVAWGVGKFGGGLRFNQVNRGDIRSLNCGSALPLSSFTIEFWYKPDYSGDPNGEGRLTGELAGGGNGGGGNNWLLQNFEGRIRFDVWPCPTCGSSEVRSNFNLRDTQYRSNWNHIAVTFNGGNEVRFYINGNLDSIKYLNQSGINTFSPPLEIGSVEGGGQIRGNIGTFRISSGVKTSFPYGSYAAITNEPTLAVGDIMTPPTVGNPDLVILGLSTYPNPDGGELVEARVQNQGTISTQNGFYTDLYLDHLPTGSGDYTGSLRFWVNDPIDPNEVITLTTVITDLSTLGGSSPKSMALNAEKFIDSASSIQSYEESSGTLYAQTDSMGIVSEPDNQNNIYTSGIPICIADSDMFENDNAFSSASTIAVGGAQTHNFDRPDDQDWVKFTAQAGSTYRMTTSNLGTLSDTFIYLYDTDGTTLLASNDDNGESLASQLDWMAPASDTFYLLIKHWNPNVGGCGTGYTLGLEELLPPSPPTSLAAIAISEYQINLTWLDNASNEVGFEIERSPDGSTDWAMIAGLGVNETSYSDTNLSPGATYYYRVRAYNNTGYSDYSNITSATTLSLPVAPSNLTADAASQSQIDLTWVDNASNEDGFELERSSDGSTDWVRIAEQGVNETSYSDTNLSQGITYFYRVRAFNMVGSSSYSNVASATTTTLSSIDQFVIDEINVSGTVYGNFLDTQVNDGLYQSITEVETGGKPASRYSYLEKKWQINVQPGESVTLYANSWSKLSSDGDTFVMAYATDDLNYVDMFTIAAVTDDNNYQIYSLPPSTSGTVYIRVKDTNHSPGNRALDTIFIDHLYVQTRYILSGPPSTPTELIATGVSASEIILSWMDNAFDENGFEIERSLDGVNWQLVATVGIDITSFSDTNLAANTTYYYRVRATNISGVSEYSNVASATTAQVITIHIGDLDGSSNLGSKGRWNATVTILVHDANENPVIGASVSGSWSGGVSGSDMCTTDATGRCSITKSNIKSNFDSVTFTITNVVQGSSTYQTVDNHDPDGDSDGSSIAIVKP